MANASRSRDRGSSWDGGRRADILGRVAAPASRAEALSVLPLALLVSCVQGNAAPSADAFDAARAWRDLEAQVALGPRPPGSEALEKTRAYIEKELAAAGLKPVRDPFEVKPPPGFVAEKPVGSFQLANVYADLPAHDPAAEMVVLCTHFDTKLCPFPFVGANDGGSGTAVLLEMARVLSKSGPRPLAYRFLFLDGEEALRWAWAGEDNTYGSRHHAAGLEKSGAADRVRACVLLDMVGDRDLHLVRESYSDRRLTEIFVAAARRIGLGAHVDARTMEVKDDHLSFMAARIPSLDLIDFEYGPENAWWHSRDDTLDKCSAESLAIAGRIVLSGLPDLETAFRR